MKRTGEKVDFGSFAFALLYGIQPDFDAHTHPLDQLSGEQKLAGVERRNEAVAATGSDDVVDILRYWARCDLKVDVLDTGQWVVLCPPMNPN